MKTALAILFLALSVHAVDSSAVTNSPATNTPPVKIRFQFKPILPK